MYSTQHRFSPNQKAVIQYPEVFKNGNSAPFINVMTTILLHNMHLLIINALVCAAVLPTCYINFLNNVYLIYQIMLK